MNAPFGRVLTAMATPMTADGEVDYDGAQRLASWLVAHGNDGLVISGTTGESPTTSNDEKDRLLRAVVEAVGDRAHVVAGVGTYDTAHSVELAQLAEKAGAHGGLVVAPYYNKPPQDGLIAHVERIASATDLPLMLYDIPGRSVVQFATPTLQRLSAHPRVVAVKDAKGDLAASLEVMATTDLAFYSGEDALNLALLAVGAVGVVSVVGHVAGERYAAMVRAIDSSDLAAARAIHAELIPAVRGIMGRTQGAIAVKAVLAAAGLIGSREVRLPLVAATDELAAQIGADVEAAGLHPTA